MPYPRLGHLAPGKRPNCPPPFGQGIWDCQSKYKGLGARAGFREVDMQLLRMAWGLEEMVHTSPHPPLCACSTLKDDVQGGAASGEVDKELTRKPGDWRERMKQRQKFWSHSSGFKMGRCCSSSPPPGPFLGLCPCNAFVHDFHIVHPA